MERKIIDFGVRFRQGRSWGLTSSLASTNCATCVKSEEMHDLFKKRRSVRKYTSHPVSDRQIKEILLAAMIAPSANNLHPVEFLVIKDKKKLKKLSQCGLWQQFIKNAPVAIVVISNPVKSKNFWLIDASIAAAYIYLEATNQGLATCWANIYKGKTEDSQDREAYVRKILRIPVEKRVVCVMPVGYPDETAKEHDRADYDEKTVHWERW
ncbi:MAG TPA: nitroreductase family protein [Candidatus Bathyarchaeia archaeon]|nr:nitroreductase family protein [Candidatus Bathyarchaeia archaeon]